MASLPNYHWDHAQSWPPSHIQVSEVGFSSCKPADSGYSNEYYLRERKAFERVLI
ncbi:hypothetical protein [Prochlorococcus marinus]|uniref:hypothetical protein n=1 Tax=Prochlorococcus marinus TaxID=1219 RepID=UPI00032312DE|nr:hypothetical protein [Prochlorococcus marinus]